jgi:hypothetical protein
VALRSYRFLAPIIAMAMWFALAPGRALAQATAQPLTLPQVVANMVERNAARAKALESYRGKRVYELNYAGLPSGFHADLTVDMTYNAPATKQFHVVSENGSRWIVNHILKRLIETEQESMEAQNRDGIELNTNNYDFTALEYEKNDTGCSYVLTVEPKIATKFLYRGRVWLDDKDFAVCRVEAEPAKNPSIWIKNTQIHCTYRRVGEFWLPSENTSVSFLRIDGRATLTIKYQDYEVQSATTPRIFGNLAGGH